MYLKEIKAQGFKSFADLTKIEFNKSINGIVGPNGSGKSNVVDAVRWVLGEQSVKSLRGSTSMTDVIFSGSSNRKEANIASVMLTFDNKDKYVNIDADEISIKRKVYKDGTNEYFINNEQCRLKDISNILMDSGIAKESFNIISQGKIEEILSTRAVDRRVVFEEAAGVLKYKKRKEEALRKLGRTNDNIKRVNDIVSEVEEQLIPLETEKDKALKYIEKSEDLKEIEISLLAFDIENMSDRFHKYKQEVEVLKEEMLEMENKSNTSEVSLLDDKKELVEVSEQLNQLQKKLVVVTENAEKLNSRKEILLERKKYEKDDQKLHNNLVDIKEKEHTVRNDIKSIENEVGSKKEDIKKIDDELISINDKISKLKESKNKENSKLSLLLKDDHITKNKIERTRDNIENNNLLPASVSNILNNPKLSGIKGVLGNLIDAPEKYSTAVSTSLGAAVNNVIVDSEKYAKEAINYLKSNSLGRVTFFPLNIIKPRGIEHGIISTIEKEIGYIGIGSELVKYDNQFSNIIKNQLGNVIVVDNIDNANNLSKKINHRYKIVTLDGELLHIGGSITGGRRKVHNVINEKYELEKLLKEHELLINNIKTLEENTNQIDYDLKKEEDLFYIKNKEKINNNSILDSLNSSLKINIAKLEKIVDEIKSIDSTGDEQLSDEEEKIISEYYEEMQKKEETEHLIKKLSAKKDQISSKIDEIEYKYRKQNSLYLEKSNNLKNKEIEVNRLDVKLDNLLNYLNDTYSLTFEAAKKHPLTIMEAEARNIVVKLKREIKEIGYVNLSAPETYDSVKERYDFLTSQRDDLEKAEDSLLKIISELDAVMEKEFIKSFNIIHEHFKRIFSELFGGGKAHLKLTDPSNILETGIEIVAEPPGKKLSSINLLSGGEKTFTAISLLFAILNSRDVPFCIFDEVEAALDEVNVEAFGKYLLKLKEKTQFILITHKKKTMEFVDVLYGITMQESGVSKLVSVRLEELNE